MAEHSAPGRAGWMIALFTAIVATLTIRALRGRPIPVLDSDGHWKGGAPWPPLPERHDDVDVIDLTDSTRTRLRGRDTTEEAEPPPALSDVSSPLASSPSIISGSTSTETNSAMTTWVAAVDGGCPDDYPVKANLRSGIFHLPGDMSYARTSPDRCYLDAAAAEEDGLRAAKR